MENKSTIKSRYIVKMVKETKKIGDLSRFSVRLSFRYIAINHGVFSDFEDMEYFLRKD